MTDAEKIARVKLLVDSDPLATDAIVTAYLDEAEKMIYSCLYPFTQPDNLTFPSKYEGIQCQLAARYFLRRGAEGEISHNENGINRTYGSVEDADLLNKIIPFAKL